MATPYTLSDNHKERLRTLAISGAQNFKTRLSNKVFRVICEDHTTEDVRFFSADFKHLTGLYSNLGDEEFYNNCVNGTLDKGNIETMQKYEWQTLKRKGQDVERLYDLLSSDTEKTVLLNELETHTYTFPVAIKNPLLNMCVAFASDSHKARSMRKASNSLNATSTKKVLAIFAKQSYEPNFGEVVYMSDALNVFQGHEELLDSLNSTLQKEYSEQLQAQKK